MQDFETISQDSLDDVTGGSRFGAIKRGAQWTWDKVNQGLSALGVYEAGRSVYDWATGGSTPAQTPPTTPTQPRQGQ